MPPPLGHSPLSFFWAAQLADMLIIALLVRKLLRELVKTRALKITVLFFAVFVVGIMLRALDFSTVGYLVERMIPFAFIALVFLFHGEIRDMLSRLVTFLEDHMPFMGHAVWTREDSINTVVECCKQLRRRQLGGLIVLERAESPRALYEGGTRLDTRVDPDLLGAMLEPPGPLHDGAVVIRNDRIVSAGVLLPLSSREDHLSGKGTRHRAALGIAEQSDAIAVVVSEETGKFTIAFDAILEGPLSSTLLREKLLALTGHRQPEDL